MMMILLMILEPNEWIGYCPSRWGSYRNPTNCSLYYLCVESIPLKFACPFGTYFNEVSSWTKKFGGRLLNLKMFDIIGGIHHFIMRYLRCGLNFFKKIKTVPYKNNPF